MRKPILTSLFIAAALAMPAAPALAAPGPDVRPAAASSGSAKADLASGKAAAAKAAAKAKAAAAKAKAKRAFVYNGTITAVDAAASTLTVKVKGGTERAARGTSVVIVVPASAVVRHDGVKATLDALGVGDKVNVKGTKAAGTLTVQRVTAVTPEVEAEVEATPAS